jgi:hypothetical protein
MDHIASGIEDIIGRFGRHNLRERLIEFDVKYVRRVLERYPDSADHHILKTFKRLQYKDSENVVEQDYVIELDGDTPGASTKDGKVAYGLVFYLVIQHIQYILSSMYVSVLSIICLCIPTTVCAFHHLSVYSIICLCILSHVGVYYH